MGEGKADAARVHDVGVAEDSPAQVGRVFGNGHGRATTVKDEIKGYTEWLCSSFGV
jgi:hypothetical protein